MTRAKRALPDPVVKFELIKWLKERSEKGALCGTYAEITSEASKHCKFDLAVSTVRGLIEMFDLKVQKSWNTKSACTDRVFVLAKIVDDLLKRNELEIGEEAQVRLTALLSRSKSPYPGDSSGNDDENRPLLDD